MNSAISRSVLFFALSIASSLAAIGQPMSAPPTAFPGSVFIGERLTYEGKASKLKISMAIADLTFTAAAGSNPDELSIKAEAVSKGTMLKLFRYSFLQEYEAIVDLSNFRILKTTKHDVQKQRIRDSEAVFDYQMKRVTYVETDPKDTNRPPRRIASEVTDPMNDMMSVIYSLRLRDLTVGDRFELSVSDSGLVYKVPMRITKRERMGTALGKVWCLRVEPLIFGPGRLIEREGKMILWLTDDKRHIPVKAEIDTGYGKAEIKLKSLTKSV